MNRVIACALLGFGLACSVVGCSDDDDVTPGNEAGSSAGGASAGKNAGGSSTQAGSATTAGKGGGGSSAGTAGTGGKPAGGSGGTGGDAGAGIGGESLGGEAGVGGDSVGGAGGAGGEGGTSEEPPQTANPYWLNKFCDTHASETLACEDSQSWATCYAKFYPYLSVGEGGGGICSNETDMESFPLTLAIIEATDNLAAKCPDTTEADWSCDLQGTPQPKNQACKDAHDAAKAASAACDG